MKVRVNDVRWDKADSLAELGPNHRRYITRLDDGGNTTVVFGDGQHGARLPTGMDKLHRHRPAGLMDRRCQTNILFGESTSMDTHFTGKLLPFRSHKRIPGNNKPHPSTRQISTIRYKFLGRPAFRGTHPFPGGGAADAVAQGHAVDGRFFK